MNERLIDAESTVAPHEVRELLSRLTERQTAGVSIEEVRSLSGLAAETGVSADVLAECLREIRSGRVRPRPKKWIFFAAALPLIGLIVWLVISKGTQPQLLGSAEAADYSGLVPAQTLGLAQPEALLLADSSFISRTALPRGLGLTAVIGKVVWGAGDAHADVFRGTLSPGEKSSVRQTIEDLLLHSRREAVKRHLSHSAVSPAEPSLRLNADGFQVLVALEGYKVHAAAVGELPFRPESELTLRAAAARIADLLLARLEDSIRESKE